MRPPSSLADPLRLDLLRASALLGPDPVAAFDRVARLAARALRVPVAQVNLITGDAQVPRAAFVDAACAAAGDPAAWRAPVGLERSYCQYVVRDEAPLVIDDAAAHPLVRDNAATVDAGIRAYASVPVRTPGDAAKPGVVLGTVCVVDFAPREWTPEDLEVLEDVAQAAAAEVARRLLRESVVELSEARYRALAYAIGQIIWTTDAEGQVTDMPQWRDYTGQTPGQVAGWGWTQAVHPDDRREAAAAWEASLAGGLPYTGVYRLRRRDGVYRWFEVRGVPVRAPTGQIREWVGCCIDVDDERARVLALEAARAQAEAASRAKSEFLSTMSHELRTPLNAIGGYADLMELGVRGPVTDAQLADLRRIRQANQHLQGLIGDILDFAKLEAGRLQLDLEPVVVDDALRDVETFVLPQLETRNVSYVRERGGPPLVVMADAERLRQVLLNLLTNAIKFTPPEGRITLSAEAVGAPGAPAPGAPAPGAPAQVAIHVADTGRGIPPEQLGRIFEPFVQLERHRQETSQQGVGLGLAISRDLARKMGGDLTVASTIGEGSTFTLTLSAAPRPSTEAR